VYEAGVFGARPARLPLSIGDPTIVTGATAVVSMLELFGYYLQRGLIDVGFLGAAQIDRFGNINTTVIGPYDHPTTRLPGSGGACEIAINAREVFVIMRQSKRSFVETIDFRTSPGNLGGADQAERIRREGGWLGRGPSVVVTDLGIYHFGDSGEMRLDSLHPGATVGRRVFIDHGMGVVIGETAEVGNDVLIYQGVSLGGTSLTRGKRHPTLGDNVTVGSGAKLLGPIAVGDGAKIGANTVVIEDVPPGATVVGNPGHPVKVDGKRVEGPDADWIHLPDPIAEAIKTLSQRIADLEQRLSGLDGSAAADGEPTELRERTGRSSAGG